MVSKTLAKLGSIFGLCSAAPRRRIEKLRGSWGTQTELMENRALLSAGAAAGPQSVAVSRLGRAAFTPPDINNSSWTISGDAPGTAQFTQTKNKVNIQVTALGETFTTKGKFKAKDPLTLTGKVRVDNPLGNGKILVKVSTTFDSNPVPTNFTGFVNIKKLGQNLNVTGVRDIA